VTALGRILACYANSNAIGSVPDKAPEGRLGSRKPRIGCPKSDKRARPEQVQQLSEPPCTHVLRGQS